MYVCVCMYFRFIKLIDCNHVIEVVAMDKWVKSRDASQIGYPRCPICNVPIKKTPRYFQYTKQTFEDIRKVKMHRFGNSEIINKHFEGYQKCISNIDNAHKLTTLAATGHYRNVLQFFYDFPF